MIATIPLDFTAERRPKEVVVTGTRRPARISAVLVLSLLLNAALAAGLGYWVYLRPASLAPTPGPAPTSAAGAGSINALGRVQPAGGVVSVVGVPGDRVLSVNARVGDAVTAGQKLLTLSGEEERRLSLATLTAQITEAEAVRKAAELAKVEKLKDAAAEVTSAKAKLAADLTALDARAKVVAIQKNRADKELGRLRSVESAGLRVAGQDLLAAETLVAQAEAEADAVGVQKAKAAEQQAAAEASANAKQAAAAADADRVIAQIPLESLRAARAAAEAKLKAGVVLSPIAGRVVKLNVRAGDTLGMTPAVQVADTGQMVVVAEVYETDIPRLRQMLRDGPVAALVDTRLPGAEALKGTTTADKVAPMIARNAVFALGPREDADRRVIEVEVALDDDAAVANLIGLQVNVTFPAK